jgi:hypothetical protein
MVVSSWDDTRLSWLRPVIGTVSQETMKKSEHNNKSRLLFIYIVLYKEKAEPIAALPS